jgi:RimJ/RimL family protein N-acetyltransferase
MSQILNRIVAAPDIPVIETERLILRGYRPEDAAPLAVLQGDMQMMRFMGGETDDTLANAYQIILTHTGHWVLHGFGKWAVEEKATGRFIGRVGFLDFPHDWPGLELGWFIAPDLWGRGYAAEAGRAARDWGFRVLGSQHMLSMIHQDNAASMAVAAKIGETRAEAFTFHGAPNILWRITRDEWERLS